ncbi:hypothetical protein BC826DRAFT_1107941 [Russula brevipes]|nr:hypothetical protein BC826DRAFT_1107941 [Russula brevipes]
MQFQHSRNSFKVTVTPDMIGTVRFRVAPVHPGPVTIEVTVVPTHRYQSEESVDAQRTAVCIRDPLSEDLAISETEPESLPEVDGTSVTSGSIRKRKQATTKTPASKRAKTD